MLCFTVGFQPGIKMFKTLIVDLHARTIVPRLIHRREEIPITMVHEIRHVIENSMQYDEKNVHNLTKVIVNALR